MAIPLSVSPIIFFQWFGAICLLLGRRQALLPTFPTRPPLVFLPSPSYTFHSTPALHFAPSFLLLPPPAFFSTLPLIYVVFQLGFTRSILFCN